MIGAIAIMLISAAAGYLVLARATDKTGWIKGLGLVLGLLIIVVSIAGIALIPLQMKSAQTSGMMSGGRPAFSAGQFKPPQFQPSQGSPGGLSAPSQNSEPAEKP